MEPTNPVSGQSPTPTTDKIEPTDNFEQTKPTEKQSEPIGSVVPQQVHPQQKAAKKSKKKPILIAIVIMLIVAGGAASYYFFTKKSSPTTSPRQQVIQNTETKTVQTDPTVYAQLGSTIYSFNTKTKKSTVVTDKLPANSQVNSFYTDGTTWRYFYTVNGKDTGQTIYLIEKDKDPIEAVAASTAYQTQAFNAEKRVMVYSVVPLAIANPTATQNITHTYVYKDGKTTEVYTSNPNDQKTPKTDFKSPLYAVGDLSNDTNRLLFRLHSCFYCDGPPVAAGFELDVASGKTSVVSQSTKSGFVSYASSPQTGFNVQEDEFDYLGQIKGNYKTTISHITALGAKPIAILAVNEPKWASALFDPSYSVVKVDLRGAKYSQDSSVTYGGIYKITGSTVPNLQKITVTGLPVDKQTIDKFGPLTSNCMAVLVGDITFTQPTTTNEVGVICIDGANATYTKIDSKTTNSTSAATVAEPL